VHEEGDTGAAHAADGPRVRGHMVTDGAVLRVGGCEGEALVIVVGLDQRGWRRLLLLNGHHVVGRCLREPEGHLVLGIAGVVEDLDVITGEGERGGNMAAAAAADDTDGKTKRGGGGGGNVPAT
jgi:hypothetical protein